MTLGKLHLLSAHIGAVEEPWAMLAGLMQDTGSGSPQPAVTLAHETQQKKPLGSGKKSNKGQEEPASGPLPRPSGVTARLLSLSLSLDMI